MILYFVPCKIKLLAQISYAERYNIPAYEMAPITRIIENFENTFWYSSSELGSEQTWNPVTKHYEGNLLKALYYPQILKAGYKDIDFYISTNSYDFQENTLSNLLVNLFKYLDEDTTNTEERMTYTYNSDGWLKGIFIMNEDKHVLTIRRHHLNYIRHDDKVTEIQWRDDSYGRLKESALNKEYYNSHPPTWQHRYHNFWLDSVGNIFKRTSYRQGNDKKYESTTYFTYDTVGRLVGSLDSMHHPGIYCNDFTFSYTEKVLRTSYSPGSEEMPQQYMNNPTIKRWFLSQDPLTFLKVKIVKRHYADISSGSSVYVSTDTSRRHDSAYFIMNGRYKVADWRNSSSPISDCFTIITRSFTDTGYSIAFQFMDGKILPDSIPQVDQLRIAYLTEYQFADRKIYLMGGYEEPMKGYGEKHRLQLNTPVNFRQGFPPTGMIVFDEKGLLRYFDGYKHYKMVYR